MPSKAVADAIEARLTANWTATVVVAYGTRMDAPTDVDGWLVVQYPVTNESRPMLERQFWQEGAFRLILNIKRGIGLAQGFEWSDTLKTLFRAVKFDGLETFEPDGPIIDDNIEDGSWIELAIVVPYRYQFVSA